MSASEKSPSPLSLRQSMVEIMLSILLASFFIETALYFWGNLYIATQINYGVGFGAFNLLFYTFLATLMFIKKNIAWTVPIIVIKYGILIVAIYLVWVHCDALWVVAGALAEMFSTAIIWLILRRFISKRTVHGPL